MVPERTTEPASVAMVKDIWQKLTEISVIFLMQVAIAPDHATYAKPKKVTTVITTTLHVKEKHASRHGV